MASIEVKGGGRRGLLGRRNVVVLLAAIGCLIGGYLTLQAGARSLAAVLLVVGYCVLFQLGIAVGAPAGIRPGVQGIARGRVPTTRMGTAPAFASGE
jgi:hypothetical protein